MPFIRGCPLPLLVLGMAIFGLSGWASAQELSTEEPMAASPAGVDPSPTNGAPATYKAPNLNPTQIPTAFVAEWGEYFVSSSIYGYDGFDDAGLERAWRTDGSVNVGLGFGNSRRLVAVELDFNLESLADTANGGSFDVRVGRELISTDTFRLQLGGGWLGLASYGRWPKPGGSPYGVITAAWPLRPNNPTFRQTMQINLGGGSGRFQRLDPAGQISDGLLASVGVDLAPNLGVSAGWAGRGLNASLSYVPLRQTPLYLTLSGANLTNSGGSGRAVAFTLSWGSSFRTPSFP